MDCYLYGDDRMSNERGKVCAMRIGKENGNTQRKHAPEQLCPP
jgi:hypothetical protein